MPKNTGLTSAQAKQKLAEYGQNILTAANPNPWYHILWSQFKDLLVVILIVAALVAYSVGETSDAAVILVIVVLNASIGFFQEFRTEKTLDALKKMVHPEIRIMRDGKEQMIETQYIVPGDLIILGEGDKIPSDGYILESHSLKIEESALTGESLPVEKKEEDIVFMGTSVARGSGTFIVEKTGMNTKFGEIARLTTTTKKLKSPLQIELERIGYFVAKLTGVVCVALFGLGMVRGDSLLDSMLFSVSVAIAAVPEGLNTTIVIALALGATVLARKHAVIKKLSSVETLGAVTTICSDKTGTLTKNEMTVRSIYLADGSLYQVSGVGYDPHHGSIDLVHKKGNDGNQNLLEKLLDVGAKCNEASLLEKENQFFILGDPTEGSLLTLYAKYLKDDQIPDFKLQEVFPFDSDRKMMSVIEKDTLLCKGSPDHILEKCTHTYENGKAVKLTKEKTEAIKEQYKQMASNALRVLACAERPLSSKEVKSIKDEKQAEQKLIFVGLVGMIDPPRDEVRAAVKKCHTAGIRVVVITGDFGITAEAIARELGIVKGKNVEVLTGDEVRKIDDETLKLKLEDRSRSLIFARSLPEQKMRIVRLLQEQGEVVAMTGDGVNDAPALKKSDIGIAMGITGTEVSKEAANMILMNDSFASIVTAIEEGRRIYENLKKFVWFIFACNIGELVVIFSAIIFNFPLPLTAILILCVDLGTDILPAIALGVDNPEDDLMQRPPRDTKQKLMDKKFTTNFVITGFAVGASITAAFLYTIFADGWWFGDSVQGDFDHAVTVTFASLVIVQLINAFSARSFKRSILQMNPLSNHFLLLSIAISVLLVICIIYIPVLNKLLGTQPLGLDDWGVVMIASIIPLFVVEGQKYYSKQQAKK